MYEVTVMGYGHPNGWSRGRRAFTETTEDSDVRFAIRRALRNVSSQFESAVPVSTKIRKLKEPLYRIVPTAMGTTIEEVKDE